MQRITIYQKRERIKEYMNNIKNFKTTLNQPIINNG